MYRTGPTNPQDRIAPGKIGARYGRAIQLACVSIIGLFVLSDVVWILNDRRVWPWDQAHYGLETLKLTFAAQEGPLAWLRAMVTAVGFKPPLLVWLAQIFVPLRGVTGDVEPSLLMLNISAEIGTYGTAYAICGRMGIGKIESAVGVMGLAAASLYIGMVHQFMVETLQGLIVALTIFCAISSPRISSTRAVSLAIAVTSLGMLVKLTMVGFLIPLAIYGALALWFREGDRTKTTPFDYAMVLLAVVLASTTAAWYLWNGSEVFRDAIGSTIGDGASLYGSRSTVVSKLAFWIGSISVGFSPFTSLSAATGAVVLVAIALRLWRLRTRSLGTWLRITMDDGSLLALVLVGTMVVQLLLFSLQLNEETRFLVPLLPLCAPIIAWSLHTIGRAALSSAFFVAFSMNGAVGQAFAQGYDLNGYPRAVWLLPVHSDNRDMDQLQAVADATCRGQQSGLSVIGVEYKELNYYSAEFYSAKRARDPSALCTYVSLGYAESNPDNSWRRLFELGARHVVTLDARGLREADAFNMTAREIAARLAQSDQFFADQRIGEDIIVYTRAFRRAWTS